MSSTDRRFEVWAPNLGPLPSFSSFVWGCKYGPFSWSLVYNGNRRIPDKVPRLRARGLHSVGSFESSREFMAQTCTLPRSHTEAVRSNNLEEPALSTSHVNLQEPERSSICTNGLTTPLTNIIKT